jgi:hypothetical protein
VVAKYNIETGCCTHIDDTRVLARIIIYMVGLVKEASDVWLHPNSFNRSVGFLILSVSVRWVDTCWSTACLPLGKDTGPEEPTVWTDTFPTVVSPTTAVPVDGNSDIFQSVENPFHAQEDVISCLLPPAGLIFMCTIIEYLQPEI